MMESPPSSPDPQAWRQQLLANMRRAGPLGQQAADYIERERVVLGFRPQDTGALYLPWWWPGKGFPRRRIYLDADVFSLETPPDNPAAICLTIHEAVHLQQGLVRALSVAGELEAWQAQYRAHEALAGAERTAKAFKHWGKIPALSPANRTELALAQKLMAEASPGYRSHWLPLFPLHQEIGHRLRAFFRRLFSP